MTLAKANARESKTFIEQASLMIVTYNHQSIFIVQATGGSKIHRYPVPTM
jgi:hypothetical protein